MPETVVRLKGLRAHGRHGVEEVERREGQEFEIDLELMYDAPVSAGDSLTGRVDYAEAADVALAAFRRTTFKTIEALADEIADVLLHRYFAIQWLTVRIRKRPPSWRDRLACVEAEVVRRR
jgi:dihydroneopterin aldolase